MNTADKIIISGSIKAVGEFSEVQGIGFNLTLTAQGESFASSKRELLNKILTPVLVDKRSDTLFDPEFCTQGCVHGTRGFFEATECS